MLKKGSFSYFVKIPYNSLQVRELGKDTQASILYAKNITYI